MNSIPSGFAQKFAFGTLAALCLSLAGLNNANADEKGNRGQLSAKDFKFVTDACAGGMMEVDQGQLAAQKAENQSVRDFGKRMVADHQKANEELKQLLTQKGVTLPDPPAKTEEKTLEHLRGLSGADFDKAYIKGMVSDHKKDVKEFQTESEKAGDADLKNWVAKTLPTIQEHLRLAQSVEADLTGVKAQASAQ